MMRMVCVEKQVFIRFGKQLKSMHLMRDGHDCCRYKKNILSEVVSRTKFSSLRLIILFRIPTLWTIARRNYVSCQLYCFSFCLLFVYITCQKLYLKNCLNLLTSSSSCLVWGNYVLYKSQRTVNFFFVFIFY